MFRDEAIAVRAVQTDDGVCTRRVAFVNAPSERCVERVPRCLVAVSRKQAGEVG
jgi:hypothetical protein